MVIGSCDAFYKEVGFDSFVELVKIQRQDRYRIPISLHYNGTDLCGDVEIHIAPGNSGIKNEFIKIASDTLKYF
jgi:hypothetical protein